VGIGSEYHIEMLRYFSEKVGRDDILEPTIRNESLHEISNSDRIRVVNFRHIKLS